MDLLTDKLSDLERFNIKMLKHDFEKISEEPSIFFNKKIKSCEFNPELRTYTVQYENSIGKVLETVLSWADFKIELFTNLSKDITHALRNLTIGLTQDEGIILVKNFLNHFDYILTKEIMIPKDNEQAELFNWLHSFRLEIIKSYQIDKAESEGLIKEMKKPAINWLGNLNSLATLIIDLNEGTGGMDKKYISAQTKELKKLITDNFLFQGQPISTQTIDTYFDTGKRLEKRAKKDVIVFAEGHIDVKKSNSHLIKKGNKLSAQTVYPVPKVLPED